VVRAEISMADVHRPEAGCWPVRLWFVLRGHRETYEMKGPSLGRLAVALVTLNVPVAYAASAGTSNPANSVLS
jgi:hypothetical protein